MLKTSLLHFANCTARPLQLLKSLHHGTVLMGVQLHRAQLRSFIPINSKVVHSVRHIVAACRAPVRLPGTITQSCSFTLDCPCWRPQSSTPIRPAPSRGTAHRSPPPTRTADPRAPTAPAGKERQQEQGHSPTGTHGAAVLLACSACGMLVQCNPTAVEHCVTPNWLWLVVSLGWRAWRWCARWAAARSVGQNVGWGGRRSSWDALVGSLDIQHGNVSPGPGLQP